MSLRPRNDPLPDLLLECEDKAGLLTGFGGGAGLAGLGLGDGALFRDGEDAANILPVRLNTKSDAPLTDDPPLRPNMATLLVSNVYGETFRILNQNEAKKVVKCPPGMISYEHRDDEVIADPLMSGLQSHHSRHRMW